VPPYQDAQLVDNVNDNEVLNEASNEANMIHHHQSQPNVIGATTTIEQTDNEQASSAESETGSGSIEADNDEVEVEDIVDATSNTLESATEALSGVKSAETTVASASASAREGETVIEKPNRTGAGKKSKIKNSSKQSKVKPADKKPNIRVAFNAEMVSSSWMHYLSR
jgi:hypothetical protein